jgi:hypothetical protein
MESDLVVPLDGAAHPRQALPVSHPSTADSKNLAIQSNLKIKVNTKYSVPKSFTATLRLAFGGAVITGSECCSVRICTCYKTCSEMK